MLPPSQTGRDVIRLPADRAPMLLPRTTPGREKGLASTLPPPTDHYASRYDAPGPLPPIHSSLNQLTGSTTSSTTLTRASTTVAPTAVQNVLASDVLSYDTRADSALSTGRMLLQHSAFSMVPAPTTVHVPVVTAPPLTTSGLTVHCVPNVPPRLELPDHSIRLLHCLDTATTLSRHLLYMTVVFLLHRLRHRCRRIPCRLYLYTVLYRLYLCTC